MAAFLLVGMCCNHRFGHAWSVASFFLFVKKFVREISSLHDNKLVLCFLILYTSILLIFILSYFVLMTCLINFQGHSSTRKSNLFVLKCQKIKMLFITFTAWSEFFCPEQTKRERKGALMSLM